MLSARNDEEVVTCRQTPATVHYVHLLVPHHQVAKHVQDAYCEGSYVIIFTKGL